jgi:hypothetical protein
MQEGEVDKKVIAGEIPAAVQLFVSACSLFRYANGPFPTGAVRPKHRPLAPMLKRSGLIPDRHQ